MLEFKYPSVPAPAPYIFIPSPPALGIIYPEASDPMKFVRNVK